MDESLLTPLIALAVAVVVLRLQAWRAVLCVAPQLTRVEVETPADATQLPGALEDAWAELEKLGFVLLGAHTEQSPLGKERSFIDGVHATEPVVASLTVGRDEQDHLVLWTQTEAGFVLTANYQRPALERPGRYLAGGLDGVAPERVLKAHLRRVPELGTPRRLDTLDARVAAAREWFAGPGKPELRQQHAVGLLWTLGALGMVSASLFRLAA